MQEFSGVYTSWFLHTDERKMALRVRKLSGAFEKPAPGHHTDAHARARNLVMPR